LQSRNVTGDDLHKFVCLAEQVGDTSKRVDVHHGVFRISSEYWCTVNGSGNGCKINCKKLLDDDLNDDIACVLTIFKSHKMYFGSGLSAWSPWLPKCKDFDTGYLSKCNLVGNSDLLDIFVRSGDGR